MEELQITTMNNLLLGINKLSGFASVLGIVLSIASFFTADKRWILVAITIIFIFLSCYIIGRYIIVSRYLEGERKISEIHNKLILDQDNIINKNLDNVILKMSNICSSISEAFETIKKERIGVCIKYINGNEPNFYVKTFCRDSFSYNNRKYDDSVYDYIMDNTDFKHIFQLMKDNKDFYSLFYCGNYLANKHQYNNTHLNTENLSSGFLSYFSRRKNWPLAYKSSVVVPFISPDGKNLEGFLCIDSPRSNGFNKEIDVVILQKIALFMRYTICKTFEKHLK